MKLNIFIHDEIIRRARALLDTVKDEENSSSQNTKQKRDIDAIWARHGNDSTWAELAEVVKLITSYRPTTLPAKRENFQVMVRSAVNQKPMVWILIKANAYGFVNLQTGYVTLGSTDQLASVEQAEEFIEGLEKLNSDEFYDWIVRTLGFDTLASF